MTEPPPHPALERDRERAFTLEPAARVAMLVAIPSGTPPGELGASLSTGTRYAALAVAGLGGIGVVLARAGLRPDLPEVHLLALAGLALAVLGGVAAAALALWPMHRRPLPQRLTGLGVFAPVVLALLPWPGVALPAPEVHRVCLTLGVGAMAATVLAFALLQRTHTAPRALAAGAAAGLVGFAVQTLRCPVNDLDHLLLAHAPLGLLAATVLAALAGLRDRA